MASPLNQPVKSSRRRFMHELVIAGSACCISPVLLNSCNVMHDQHNIASSGEQKNDVMDEALEMFARTGPEYAGGLANHGPMAAEALVSLGRHESVISWVEKYKLNNLRSQPEAHTKISHENWQNALGDFNRAGDWIAFFNRELKETSWRSVLGQWLVRLAPGLVAAAAHGLIRTGHAARSLAHKETEGRRQELALPVGRASCGGFSGLMLATETQRHRGR
jgi:hypothetical protein